MMETDKRQTLVRLLGLLKTKRLAFFVGLFGVAITSTAERLYVAYIIKSFTDSITGQDLGYLRGTIINWFLFYLIIIGPTLLFLFTWRSAIIHITTNIRQMLFKHLQRLPIGYHELHHSGEAMSTMTNDVTDTEQAYQQDLLTLVQSSIQGLSAVIFMLVLEWRLALLIIFSGLAPLIINSLFAKPLRRVGDEIQAKLGIMSERLSDLLAGFQVIRTFNLVDWIIDRFSQANQDVLSVSMRRVQLEAFLSSGNDLAGSLFFVPFFVGSYFVLTGHTTFGILIALVQLNNQVSYFVFSLGGTISRIQSSLAAADRIFTILDSPPEPERYDPWGVRNISPKTISDAAYIDFKDVEFSYNNQPVLKGVSFQLDQGQVAAIVGPSGGGKTTIFKLLMGCYPIKSGTILISGKSVSYTRLIELRNLLAYVPQDAYLYSGTIIDNIRYGKPGASDEQVIAVAKAANAHDFILTLPSGYLTLVGERGAKLSGGQRQRIAIARALLKDSPILLLDEATSALDSESEQLVQEALNILMKGRTTIAIAHRLSTIENADVIFVLDQGRVVEQGKHIDLLARGGLYHDLYEMQFKQNQPVK